jgi:four helix bundle protein
MRDAAVFGPQGVAAEPRNGAHDLPTQPGFPEHERYGVTSQLRRAAVSVPANIAEGSKRNYPKDYARFLNIAEGSLSETEYLLILCQDLDYLSSEAINPLRQEADEILRMLNSLRERVEASESR